MNLRHFGIAVLLGASVMIHASRASQLDEWKWKSRVLVVVAPAGNAAAQAQRRIYESAAKGMAERSIVLIEALDDQERSQRLRSRFSADGRRFQVFLVGKDGQTAISSEKPVSADNLFALVDAMPMRREEMRRGR